MSWESISVVITVILAFIGYFITYYNNLVITRRKERLALINMRINEFYGPLYVCIKTNTRSYATLLKKMNRSSVFEDEKGFPNDEELKEWRVWVKAVFFPKNEYIELLIMEKAYLIQESQMPDCLLQFVTHVSAYRAVIHKWAQNDFTEDHSVIDFPKDLEKYASNSYTELKKQQLELIEEKSLFINWFISKFRGRHDPIKLMPKEENR